jgi:hypothetical protein
MFESLWRSRDNFWTTVRRLFAPALIFSAAEYSTAVVGKLWRKEMLHIGLGTLVFSLCDSFNRAQSDSSKSCRQTNSCSSRTSGRDIIVIVSVQVVRGTKQILNVCLHAPMLSKWIEQRCVSSRVAWNHDGVVYGGEHVTAMDDSKTSAHPSRSSSGSTMKRCDVALARPVHLPWQQSCRAWWTHPGISVAAQTTPSIGDSSIHTKFVTVCSLATSLDNASWIVWIWSSGVCSVLSIKCSSDW